MPPFTKNLLRWYEKSGRELPWRGQSNPYVVWISEIMLQQTRVETVVGFFERWMKRFPTTASLAAASEQEVLSQWEGLGYYSRARNLHRAAKIIISNHDGVVPKDIGELQRLPGIGRYTAGAIASIAYGMDAAALDGNIRRVLARLFDVETPADSVAGLKQLWKLAEENLPPGKAGDYNQAMMDLGASLCLPRNPQCQICPLRTNCKARKVGTQQVRPVLKQKPAIPHFVVTAAVIIRRGKVLLAQRPADKLLGGMWEFPGGKVEKGETLEACLRREILEELGTTIRVGKSLGVYKHAYTHFRITVHAFCCELAGTEPRPLEVASTAWVHLNKLVNYPMGKVDRLIARRIGEDGDTIPL